jgi:hypothetical protein
MSSLTDLFAIAFPVFGLIAVGYGARWAGLLGPRAGEGLSEFVFVCAVPTLIFKTMAQAKLPAVQPWGYWLSYFLSLAVVWAISMIAARRAFGATHGESVVAGFSAAQSNTVLVGIPLILKAYGEAGAVPLFLLIAIHLPITMTAATLLMEGASGFDARLLARRLVLHPILLGLFAGLVLKGAGLTLSGPALGLVEMLSGAAAPCALVAMGLTLKQAGWPKERALLWLVASLKLIVHPALVYVLATRVFSMPQAWAGVAVLFAAMPSGVNAYLFAERYREGVAFSSAAIALSTALAGVTAMLWLWLLGVA